MEIFMSVYLFIIGTVFGSFFNVVGLRVPVGASIAFPRSHCPKCHHILKASELIPVLSYVLLKGACKHCRTKIPMLYPATEFVTGILFAISPLFTGWNGELLVTLTLISLLVVIVITDVHYMLIPNRILAVFAIIFVIIRSFVVLDPWWSSFVGAMLGFSLLLLIGIVSRGGMGGGDMKLFAVIGLALGWQMVLLSLFFASFFGAIWGIMGIILKKVQKGQPIPFGPFIAVGTLVAHFFGAEMITAYFNLIAAI